MIEHVLFGIVLISIMIVGMIVILKPEMAIGVVLKFFLPGYHVVKNRKKAKKKVKKETKKEEVFP
jgi:hypothetical protein